MPGKLIISDANVLIDMEVGELVEQMFRLDYEVAVPDVLYHDELAAQHAQLLELGLRVLELESEGVAYVAELIQRHRRLRTSRYDLFAAALARQEQCPLLTGDSHLCILCLEERIEVHGTIWLIENLHDAHLINATEADEAYKRMLAGGRRLPVAEIATQLRRFRAKRS